MLCVSYVVLGLCCVGVVLGLFSMEGLLYRDYVVWGLCCVGLC